MEKNMFSINENQYKEMTDEKLIENIKQDDNMALNCLLERYNDVVNMKANKFFRSRKRRHGTRRNDWFI